MVRVLFLVFAQLCLFLLIQGKTLDQCQLAHELAAQGFNDLENWVCLVESESSGRTDVVGPPNTDGSRDHGLFQINDHYWCEDGPNPGKDCNIRCSDIVTDDITVASTCAKKIFEQMGFAAWVGWNNKCNGHALPDLSSCGL